MPDTDVAAARALLQQALAILDRAGLALVAIDVSTAIDRLDQGTDYEVKSTHKYLETP